MNPNQVYDQSNQLDDVRRIRRAKLWFIIAFSLIVILVLGFAARQLYTNNRFYVVSTSQTQNMTTLSSEFNINFNHPISKNGLSVSVMPGNASYQGENDISGNSLGVQLSIPLNPTQTYTIMVNKVTSTNGKVLTNLSYTFIPKSINKSQLSESDQENLIKRNQQSPAYKDPILINLPHSTLDYDISPYFIADNNDISHLVLKIQLLVPPGQDTNSYSANDKQEALQYIKSLGLDPSKYNIQYQIINEQLTGV
jgi:hypothetical protein